MYVVTNSGWWHVVLNLDLTVAVTQNIAELQYFPQVRRAVFERLWVGDRMDDADNWLANVAAEWPELEDSSSCVVCGQQTSTVLPLAGDRRLCSECVKIGTDYRIMSADDATRDYGKLFLLI